jgi:hypothetical protein
LPPAALKALDVAKNMPVLPAHLRYMPPATLPTTGETGIDTHIRIMERNFREDPTTPDREEHRVQWWQKNKKWSNMKAGELEGFILWHGRWLATYTRHAERLRAMGQAVDLRDTYILVALHATHAGFVEHFKQARLGHTSGPDMMGIVRIHQHLCEPPVMSRAEDRLVTVGPSVEQELKRGKTDTSDHADPMEVPLSLVQAYFDTKYGTNWLEGFLRHRVVDYPPDMRHFDPRLDQLYPQVKHPAVSWTEVPILPGCKKTPKGTDVPPGIRVLRRKEWVDEPSGDRIPRPARAAPSPETSEHSLEKGGEPADSEEESGSSDDEQGGDDRGSGGAERARARGPTPPPSSGPAATESRKRAASPVPEAERATKAKKKEGDTGATGATGAGVVPPVPVN